MGKFQGRFVLGQVSSIHSFIHPWWGKPISIITIDGKTSKEGFSSPWIGNFQRTSLCRQYEKEGRKEGRKEGDDESPGSIKFHPFAHSSMMRKAHVHNLHHLLSSFVSLHAAPLVLPLLRLLFFAAIENHHLLSHFFLLGWGRYLLSVRAEELCHLFLLGGGCLPISASFFFSTCEFLKKNLWVLPKINQTTLFGSILIPHHHHHQIFASIFCPVSWGRSFTIANFFLQFILFFWVLEAS